MCQPGYIRNLMGSLAACVETTAVLYDLWWRWTGVRLYLNAGPVILRIMFIWESHHWVLQERTLAEEFPYDIR